MYKTIAEKHTALTNNILSQARYFLTEAGEFYPFGAAINMRQELRPVGFYMEEEYPEANEVLKLLEQRLRKGIEQKEYSMAAIGIDVHVNTLVDDEIEQKPAIQVRILDETGSTTTSHFLYMLTDGEYTFKPFLIN